MIRRILTHLHNKHDRESLTASAANWRHGPTLFRRIRRLIDRWLWERKHPHARYARLHRKYERLLKS